MRRPGRLAALVALAAWAAFGACALPAIAGGFSATPAATPAGTPPAAPPAGWTSFRNGPGNPGRTAVRLRQAPDRGAPWAYQTQGLIWGTAVVDAGGTSYVGAADKRFYALDPAGRLRWSYPIFDRADALIDSAAALHPAGLVVVPGGDGYLHALDRETGALRWVFAARAASAGSHQRGVVVNSFEGNVQVGPDGTIYAGSDNGTLYALDAQGRERWRHGTGMMVWSCAAVDAANRWLAFGSLDGHVYLLDPATGRELARFAAGGEVKASVAIAGDRLIVGTAAGRLWALDVAATPTGYGLTPAWHADWGAEIYASAALDGARAIVAGMDGRVRAFALDDGQERWSYATGSRVAASPVVSEDGVVLVGARNGKLYALDAASGERLWSHETTDARVRSNLDASPAVRPDGVVVVGGYDGRVHGISPAWAARHGERGGHADPEPPTPRSATGRPALWPEDGRGRVTPALAAPVGLAETLRLRLVSPDGQDLALQPDVAVTLVPPTPVRARLASDGRTLDLAPAGFFRPATRYQVRVTAGLRARREAWLVDRFWPDRRGTLDASVAFESAAATPVAGPLTPFGVRRMFLIQPAALETYTPAALEGQAFVLVPFDAQPTGAVRLLGLPALSRPAADGPALRVLPEPSKVFVLAGEARNGWLRASGRFALAAMGGTIPFPRFDCAARLGALGEVEAGEFTAECDLLGLRGNGQAFSFPPTLLNDVADERLRMVAHGSFLGCPAPRTAPPALAGAPRARPRGGVRLRWASSAAGVHVLTAIAADGRVHAQAAIATAGEALDLPLAPRWLFWDAEALDAAR